MSGYAGGYAINPFPTGPGVGTEATDKAVLYWDGVNNLIKGSSDLLFDATLKYLTLGTTASLFWGTDIALTRAAAGKLSLSTGSALYLPSGTAAAPGLATAADPATGIYLPGSRVGFSAGGYELACVTSGNVLGLDPGAVIGWGVANPYSNWDVKLYRDAANTLALRNSTTAQTFRIYGTYTNASNYERLTATCVGGTYFTLQTQAAGTGTLRIFEFGTADGTWRVDTTGNLYPNVNNLFDLGSSTRLVRNIYWGTQALAPDGSATAPSIARASQVNNGFWFAGSSIIYSPNGSSKFSMSGSGLIIDSAYPLMFGNSEAFSGDVLLYRDGAAATLALRNSTNAQTFRIYETYTDGSNYSRLKISGASTMSILAEAAGTGTQRQFNIGTAGAAALGFYVNGGVKWFVDTDYHLKPGANVSYDVGASALKARDIYSGGYVGGTVAKTADYTVAAGDHVIRVNASGGNKTITLPAAASHTGRIIHIKKTDSSANYVRIDGNSTELVEDAQTQDLLYQGENLMLQCDGSQWWIL